MAGPLQTVFMESVTAQTQTKSVGLDLGTIRYEGSKVYQYIYNSGGGAIAATYGVVLSGTGSYSACVTNTSSIAVCFGVAERAISATAYGWVLKRGICTFEADGTTSFVVGAPIQLSTNGTFGNPGSWVTGVATVQICGFAVSAIASGDSGLGYFNCL